MIHNLCLQLAASLDWSLGRLEKILPPPLMLYLLQAYLQVSVQRNLSCRLYSFILKKLCEIVFDFCTNFTSFKLFTVYESYGSELLLILAFIVFNNIVPGTFFKNALVS